MRTKISLVMVAACLLLAAVPGAALAQSPTADGYSGVAGQQESGGNTPGAALQVSAATVGDESTPAAATSAGSTLPFTGLEVGVIALAGICLLGGGVVLYRMSRGGSQRLS
jgi:hypothetical protein